MGIFGISNMRMGCPAMVVGSLSFSAPPTILPRAQPISIAAEAQGMEPLVPLLNSGVCRAPGEGRAQACCQVAALKELRRSMAESAEKATAISEEEEVVKDVGSAVALLTG